MTVPATEKETRWSWSVGDYGRRVLVFEERNGRLYGQIRGHRVALKHRSQDLAKKWARDQEKKLRDGLATAADPKPTVAKVFAIYVARETPRKGSSSRYQDERAVKMFTRFLGAYRDLSKLTLAEWQDFIDARTSGAISPRGEPVPAPHKPDDPKRRPVGPRAVEADLEWLRMVIRWACTWRDKESGQYLMHEDPTRGREFTEKIPHEENPRRPLATDDRYEAVQGVADAVHPLLPVILALVHGTGRRIRAVLALQHHDLLLAKGDPCPALDRFLADRPAIGAVRLFSEDGTRPVTYERASKWLRQAERRAKLAKQDGSLWHAYRRGWATARKNLPAKDVAFAGGWKNVGTLETIYQQPDPESTYRAVAEPMQLREAQS